MINLLTPQHLPQGWLKQRDETGGKKLIVDPVLAFNMDQIRVGWRHTRTLPAVGKSKQPSLFFSTQQS